MLGGRRGGEGRGWHIHAIHRVWLGEGVAHARYPQGAAKAAVCIAGTTALSAAVMQHKHAAVQLLLQSGAQVERTNKDGVTPIQLAQVKAVSGQNGLFGLIS